MLLFFVIVVFAIFVAIAIGLIVVFVVARHQAHLADATFRFSLLLSRTSRPRCLLWALWKIYTKARKNNKYNKKIENTEYLSSSFCYVLGVFGVNYKVKDFHISYLFFERS